MGQLLVTLLFILGTLVVHAEPLYVKTFGNPDHKAIIHLHGGPGGSALDFELTTAQALADRGFFVIVYDRRGEGRSADDSARYTFKQTFDDLNQLYDQYKLKKATLIGHSFGGIVATLYADQYPEKVERIVLAGTPVSLQQSFTAILQGVTTLAEAKKDTATLRQIATVKAYDHSSIYFSSGCFMLAMQNGLYNTKTPNAEAQKLYADMMGSAPFKDYMKFMSDTQYKYMYNPTMGFYNHEKYTSLDITGKLKGLKANDINVYGVYGKEDGLFDASQLETIRSITGANRFAYLDNCSHGVFVDQQAIFLDLLKNWTK